MKHHNFGDLLDIIDTLRRKCPWDRQQTARSLRSHLIEESWEAVEAIDEQDPEHVCEELGDILLLVGMITRIYSESGSFDIADVIRGISEKLIRRHPHVFADVQVQDAGEVLKNWEKIKSDVEGRGRTQSALDGLNGSLPPLERSYKMQKKAAKKGFDWPDPTGPLDKIHEELREIENAENAADTEDEIGDLLFSVVNYARHLGVDPSLALAGSGARFEKRFRYAERQMKQDGIAMNQENAELMDQYWMRAKEQES